MKPIVFLLIFVALFNPSGHAQIVRIVHRDGAGHLNTTTDQHRIMIEDKCAPAKPCEPGLILPIWGSETDDFPFKLFRAIIYLTFMFYLFLGVSIVADRFMAAIEVITSQERELTIKKPNGDTTIVLVRIWNETVSNLTLMALGSSAPEILLSIIEICGNGFEAGDLGPGTIVGSAAFNLFCIIAICIMVIPSNENRRIERNDVFWVTVAWSTFAYVWLYLILCVFSPNVVEVWEGLLTFAFFFLTVISAYVADRYAPVLGRRIVRQNVTGFSKSTGTANGSPTRPTLGVKQPTNITLQLDIADNKSGESLLPSSKGANDNRNQLIDPEIIAFEEHRTRFVRIFQKLRMEHPDMPLKQIGKLVTYKCLAEAPKSRAFRRMEAVRRITGTMPPSARLDSPSSGGICSVASNNDEDEVEPLVVPKEKVVQISFHPCHYICAEDIGILKLFVKCDRGAVNMPTIVTVNYETVPGSAKEHEDYIPASGMVTFGPHQDYQEIHVRILNDDRYEFDEDFFVKLNNPKAVFATNTNLTCPAALGTASEAMVIIVDDDHCGHFSFESQVFRVNENQGTFDLMVNRQRGARGKVSVPYTITEGRAKRGIDFNCEDGELVFHDRQTTNAIRIRLINDDRYEKNEDFFVQLGQPVWVDQPSGYKPNNEDVADGRPFLGENIRAKIVIKEDDELKSFVDRLIARANCSIMVGTSSWRQQFLEALSPSGEITGYDIEGNAVDSPLQNDGPGMGQLAMHYISLPWKLVFAFIPPTDYLHGWVCFTFSIAFIGLLTAVIGDVASHFGCTVGLKDTVTAITLVALGTSVPDTFASKLAAVQDKTADSSIGNVTGSNAVNVFLGIGVAWAIAAIYHSWNGSVFHVHAGSLAVSVALFLIGSIICVTILQMRRFSKTIGAELGGPTVWKWISSGIFLLTWISYITYCTLDAYCLI